MANEGMSPAEIVTECNRLIMSGQALEAVERFVAEDFIEHNPTVRGGNREGFIEHLEAAGLTNPDSPKMKMTVDRTIEAGDLVVTHIHVESGPDDPILVFMDIYRIRDGKLAEHWDVMQPMPATNNGNPHTMW